MKCNVYERQKEVMFFSFTVEQILLQLKNNTCYIFMFAPRSKIIYNNSNISNLTKKSFFIKHQNIWSNNLWYNKKYGLMYRFCHTNIYVQWHWLQQNIIKNIHISNAKILYS